MTEGEVIVLLYGRRYSGLHRPGVAPDRVQYADGTLRPGGSEDKCQENRGNGMPPMPSSRGMCRQVLYPADDGDEEELQEESAGAG